MILTGDTYRLDQLPSHSIANITTEPGCLAEATERLLERTATHTRTVTTAQRRLFDLWLNNPLDAAVEHSTDEFAETFETQETRDQIAYHYRRITVCAAPNPDGGIARFAMTGRHVDDFMGVPASVNGHRAARHHHLTLPRRPGYRVLLPGGYAGPAGPGGGRACASPTRRRA